MAIQAFSYDLPPDRIAQRPVEPYDRARLLVIERPGGILSEDVFCGLPKFLRPTDLVIFNNTRVIPARLFARNEHGSEIEILLARELEAGAWRCLVRPLRRVRAGQRLCLGDGLEACLLEKTADGQAVIRFEAPSAGGDLRGLILAAGTMPVPPYVRGGRADEQDRQDYQTHFAERDGSIAAPTASLHFTPSLMGSLQELGCEIRFLTLHVGLASIQPVYRPGQEMNNGVEPERYLYDGSLLNDCLKAREQGRRVVAVGTTVVRALESMVRMAPSDDRSEQLADIFITPGFEFRLVDCIITNFHQPATTHLLLVEAFMGQRELLSKSYAYALEGGFRFLSYGDGMLII